MERYLTVDGHQVYSYEWDNNGEAVVLLHGGLSQTSHWDSYILPAVEDDFHVFAYDRTAHGFTGDRTGSLHFEYQVKEAITYLESIVQEPAHLIGFSDGAIIAFMVAMKRPELVKSIISMGGNYHFNGTLPLPPFDGMISPEDQEEYNQTSPDAPHTLLEKTQRMVEIWKSEPSIDKSDLAKIQCPVLVLAGDDDVIDHHHTVDLFEALPLGQLAIVPGASHIVMKDKPGLTQALVSDFLGDLSQPVTRMPMRRTNPRTE
jgi:pimeloyl-ACP methyl ester carboxylesterase